jgi:hypothetical protein
MAHNRLCSRPAGREVKTDWRYCWVAKNFLRAPHTRFLNLTSIVFCANGWKNKGEAGFSQPRAPITAA